MTINIIFNYSLIASAFGGVGFLSAGNNVAGSSLLGSSVILILMSHYLRKRSERKQQAVTSALSDLQKEFTETIRSRYPEIYSKLNRDTTSKVWSTLGGEITYRQAPRGEVIPLTINDILSQDEISVIKTMVRQRIHDTMAENLQLYANEPITVFSAKS